MIHFHDKSHNGLIGPKINRHYHSNRNDREINFIKHQKKTKICSTFLILNKFRTPCWWCPITRKSASIMSFTTILSEFSCIEETETENSSRDLQNS